MKKNQPPLKIVPIEDIPKAGDVPTENLIDVFRICTQMEKICTDNDGIGLSAVQVGIPWKLFIVLHDEKKKGYYYKYLLNCEYAGHGDKGKSIEGCLSLRNSEGNLRRFEVSRFPNVIVTGKELAITDKGLELKDLKIALDGLYSIVYQHEIDHQNGILISDIGVEVELY
jgi:peptide deformylase